MYKVITFFKTIRGRIAILVIIFVVLLFSLSSVIYFKSAQLKRIGSEHKTWGMLQLHDTMDKFGYVCAQNKVLEDVLYNRVPSLSDREANRDGALLAVENLYREGFKKLGVKERDEIIKGEKEAKSAFYDETEKIYTRMEEMKNDSSTFIPIKDSIIYNILTKEIGKTVGMFYSSLTKTQDLSTIGRNTTADFLEDGLGFITLFILVVSVIATLIIFFLWNFLGKSILKSIKRPQMLLDELSLGKLPQAVEPSGDEFDAVIEVSNKLGNNIKHASQFAMEIGDGNFDSGFNSIGSDDMLGNALLNMRKNLKVYSEKEKQQNWINTGLTKFADILRNTERELEEVGADLIGALIRYLNANQGGIFLYEEDTHLLKLIACYAYDRRKYLEKTLEPGEGLVGQCFLEGDKIILTEIPANYIKITSGIGESVPRCLILIPLKNDDRIQGVIEIASFNEFKEYEIEFVEKVSQSISSVLSTIKANNLTKELLRETEMKTLEMRSQEEELRQNLEELHATQEEMRRRESIYIEKINFLQQRVDELEKTLQE